MYLFCHAKSSWSLFFVCPLPHGLPTCLSSVWCLKRTTLQTVLPSLICWLPSIGFGQLGSLTWHWKVRRRGEGISSLALSLPKSEIFSRSWVHSNSPLPLLRCQHYLFPFPICPRSGNSLPWMLSLGVSPPLVCFLSFAKLVSSCPFTKASIEITWWGPWLIQRFYFS